MKALDAQSNIAYGLAIPSDHLVTPSAAKKSLTEIHMGKKRRTQLINCARAAKSNCPLHCQNRPLESIRQASNRLPAKRHHSVNGRC